MNITISQLKLVNFKGVRSLHVNLGTVADIFGENGTGKTTIFDAFTWLLFDKDSTNKKDFQIKTVDTVGKVIHGLDHEVEGTLVIDGRVVTLRKVYSEKWAKKRGSATSEFTGHTTDYFIDGVPVKQKEYKDRIDSFIDETVFKLLTSPSYFNEQLSWQERRKTLLQICGDISDEEVISTNTSLARLPAILSGRSIEDHRKVIAARRSEINKELEKIPVRIDEAERSKPDTDGLNEQEIRAQIDTYQRGLSAAEEELSRLQSGGEVSVQEVRHRQIEAELIAIRNSLQSGALDAISNQRMEVQRISGVASDLQFNIQRTERQITDNNVTITNLKDTADRLRTEWNELDHTELAPEHDDNCPTCGQALPQEQVQAAHAKAVSDFNLRKSERLEFIRKQGIQTMGEAVRLEDENGRLGGQLIQAQEELRKTDSELQEARQKLTDLQSNVQDVSNHPEYVAKNMELEAVKVNISGLRISATDRIQKVQQEISQIRDKVRNAQTLLAGFNQIRVLENRIEDLKAEERRLAAEFERLEEEIYLTEEFIRTKVELLESRINSKFRFARFKLFEQQINGGVTETCETLFAGIPYGSGLNNAAKINVGLDIINTLSEHYGITAPIFIDNRESVTQLIPCRSQVVSLIVSAADKVLRVETSGGVEEAV